MTRPPPGWEPAWTAGALGLLLYTLARGLDRVSFYAAGHWLFTWRHGFVKRGLVGTLASPVLTGKTGQDIQPIVTILATVVLTLLCGGLVYAGLVITRRARATQGGGFVYVSVLAFLGSSGVIAMASTLGYLDHVLACLALLGVGAASRGRPGLAALACVAGLAVHEIFVFYGLPVVAFTVALRARVAARGSVLRAVGAWGAPVVGFGLVLLASQSTVPAERLLAIRQDLLATHYFQPDQVEGLMYPLDHGLLLDLRGHAHLAVGRALDWRVGRMAYPPALALTAAASALLVGSGLRRWAVLAGFVVLAPLAIHALGQDTPRFTNLVVMQAYFVLFAVARVAPAGRVSRPLGLAVGVLGVLALAAAFTWRAPLMGGRFDGDVLFGTRANRAPAHRTKLRD